jgi:hypothetical protein
VTRRTVLLVLAAAAAAVASLLEALTNRRTLWLTLERHLAPRIDRSSPPGRLSGGEMDTVLAYADVLLSDAGLSPSGRADLEEYVRDRCEHEPGYRATYQLVVSVLDEAASGPFVARSPAERRRIVRRRDLHRYDVRARDWLWSFDRRGLAVRALAARDLVTGYFLSPAGWAVVGYEAFPGRCRDLTDYTRAG